MSMGSFVDFSFGTVYEIEGGALVIIIAKVPNEWAAWVMFNDSAMGLPIKMRSSYFRRRVT